MAEGNHIIVVRVYLPRLCYALHALGLHRCANLLVRPMNRGH